jgi:hypothetical protein
LELTGNDLACDYAGYQETADYEEDIDANKSRSSTVAVVKKDYGKYRQSAKAFDVWPETGVELWRHHCTVSFHYQSSRREPFGCGRLSIRDSGSLAEYNALCKFLRWPMFSVFGACPH